MATTELIKCEHIVGIKIKSRRTEKREFEGWIVSRQGGHVSYVVLKSGAFIKLGGQVLALPWNAISCFTKNGLDENKKS